MQRIAVLITGLCFFSNFTWATGSTPQALPTPPTLEQALKAPVKLSKAAHQQKAKLAQKTYLKSKKGRAPASADPGALIKVSMSSQVGVLLDEIPASIKTRVRSEYLNKAESFWKSRARMQVEATLYRLVYRNFYYSNKGQLPLPPVELWQFTVDKPKATTVDGHDLIIVNYQFSSTLLSTLASVVEAEPKLDTVGGKWTEDFVLPADPELLLERTGYACMDEEDFPPNSVDTENARTFFDHACKAGSNSCHVTQPYPSVSCNTALKDKVGRIPAGMSFERLAWNATLAQSVRLGSTTTNGADLEVVKSGIEDNRLIYRYIAPNSCAIAEGCVSGSGWRRLLQFTATVSNIGSQPAHLGDVSASSALVQHNMFEYSACHGHMHFSHYGKFTFGTGTQQLGSKRAFCLESTSRYSNNETTPLTHPYTCQYQGIQAGWGDDYIAGIECQWVDVTPVVTPVTAPLGFQSNPDQFICEGQPNLDAQGNFTFTPTTFTTETGEPVDRISCNFNSNWDANNLQTLNVTIPKEGSFVTTNCQRGQDGPLRNCGFRKLSNPINCAPGKPIKLSCSLSSGAKPQILRICEASRVLNVGIACTTLDASYNQIVEDSKSTFVNFTCPVGRDTQETGGQYSLFTAPAHLGDSEATITCVDKTL